MDKNKKYKAENTYGLVDYRYEYHYDSEQGSWICEESHRCGGPLWVHGGTYKVSEYSIFGEEMES